MSKTLLINDPGFSKYKDFCLEYYPNIVNFFRQRKFDISWFHLCQVIYLGPSIVRYCDKWRHSNMQILPTLYNIQLLKTSESLGDIVGFFDKLASEFDVETVKIDTRYNILKNMVYNVTVDCTDKLFLEIKCQEFNACPITIGNMKFLMRSSSIETFNEMVEMLRNEFKMEKFSIIEDVYRLDKGSGFLFMCNALKISPMRFKSMAVSQIKTIVSDFLHISQYTYKEQIQCMKCLRNRIGRKSYFRFTSWKEIRSYKHYILSVITRIKNDLKKQMSGIDKYKLEDIPNRECNKYKIVIEQMEDKHPDYLMFKFLMKLYIKIRNLDLKNELEKLYKTIEANGLDHKLLYLRTVIKDVAAEYDMMWKNRGYILLYNMENLFGYRCDRIKNEELEKQAENNFNKENDKNGSSQVQFFLKYFEKAISWFQRSSKNSVLTRLQGNLGQLVGGQTYYNPHLFFDADGVTHEKIKTSRGKEVNMSKTQFFSSLETVGDFFKNISPRFHDYNSVVIKRETVKDRIVVNTSLDTYIPLAKIEYLLHRCYKGINPCYSLLDSTQKVILYGRLLKYCIYNKYVKKKYVLLPLDYSSYDTTITFDLIKETMKKFGSLTPYSQDINTMVHYFEQILKGEVIKFKELDREYRYRYGMLSGWKITNLVESLLNFVISFGVVEELGYRLEDIVTMGDDLVLVLDQENLNKEELSAILKKISECYAMLGFQVHDIKNMVGYEAIEFLRNYYNGLTVVTYPIRSLTSLAYCKPTSHLEFNNYSNYKMVLDEFIYKNGCFMFYKEVYNLLNLSSNPNIKQWGFKFYQNPEMFNLKHKFKFEYKVNDPDLIRKSQLYKYYVKVFGDKNEKYVYSFIKNSVLSKQQVFEVIEPRKVRVTGFNKHTGKLVAKIVNYFKHIYSQSRYPDIVYNVGDYYINQIAIRIFEKDRSVINILHNVLDLSTVPVEKKIHYHDGLNHITRSNAKLILNGYKLRIWNVYYNSAIVKQIKQQLFNYLIYQKIIMKKISAENVINIFLNNVISSLYKELSSIYFMKISGEVIPIYLSVA